MNKTVSINLGGGVFTIEESAYEALKGYLQKLKTYFGSDSDAEEIIGDIEQRIAEMFQTWLKKSNSAVITDKFVEEAIAAMGTPEDFEKADEEESSDESAEYTGKRLFRDAEQRALGGVCAGIAAYFNTEALWVRLFFVFLVIVSFGTALVVYLILWAIIPAAKTRLEKLSMKGETINVANLQKTMKEEFDAVKDNFTGKKDKKDIFTRIGNFAASIVELLFSFLKDVFRVGATVFGAIFALTGFAGLLFLLIGTTIFLNYVHADYSFAYPFTFVNYEEEHYILSFLILTFLIPALFLIFGGLQLLLKVRFLNRFVTLGLLLLWFIGVGVSANNLKNILFDVRQEGERRVVQELQPNKNIYLQLDNYYSMQEKIDAAENKGHGTINFSDEDHPIRTIDLSIERNEGDKLILIQNYKAKGSTISSAYARTKEMVFNYVQDDSVLALNYYFEVPKRTLYRGQELDVTLLVPVGTKLHLEKNIKHIWHRYHRYDCDKSIDGVSMKNFIMTSDGLECLEPELEGSKN